MFIFSRHFWRLYKVSLDHKFPAGAPVWVRVVSPILWVVYYLFATLANGLQKLRVKLFGPASKRKHLLKLNHSAIIERGGDPYGDHVLLKCPECGTPVLHDGEHDYFYPDASDLSNCQSLASNEESCPCSNCQFKFTGRIIYQVFEGQRSSRKCLITTHEVKAAGLDWILGSD